MPNITNQFIGNIIATEDVSGLIPINKSNGSPAFDSSVAQYIDYLSLTANPTVIALPQTTCYQLYIRNIDPNGHVLGVNIQPPSGPPLVLVSTLSPNDIFTIWQKPGGIGAGFIQLSFTVAVGPTICELFIGG